MELLRNKNAVLIHFLFLKTSPPRPKTNERHGNPAIPIG
jgi:hypothetical protein